MNLAFNLDLAVRYKNQSQKIRVLTEEWTNTFIYCPNCGESISKYYNNKPAADFYCPNCLEDYELKSKKNFIGSKIVDGAYGTMVESLNNCNNPNFFLLNYKLETFEVVNFLVIPKHFFISEMIEKRKPLTDNARRAGWVGCNTPPHNTPNTGKIYFIKDGIVKPKSIVISEWKKTLFLREQIDVGWAIDIIKCVETFRGREFTLSEVYKFEAELSIKHPDNKHIKDKIRQQLQLLRDKNYLTFVKRGIYKLI